MKENQYEEDLEGLSQHESFARFIQMIYTHREQTIKDLQEASAEGVLQISGKIIAYDHFLELANWEKLRYTHRDRLV